MFCSQISFKHLILCQKPPSKAPNQLWNSDEGGSHLVMFEEKVSPSPINNLTLMIQKVNFSRPQINKKEKKIKKHNSLNNWLVLLLTTICRTQNNFFKICSQGIHYIFSILYSLLPKGKIKIFASHLHLNCSCLQQFLLWLFLRLKKCKFSFSICTLQIFSEFTLNANS